MYSNLLNQESSTSSSEDSEDLLPILSLSKTQSNIVKKSKPQADQYERLPLSPLNEIHARRVIKPKPVVSTPQPKPSKPMSKPNLKSVESVLKYNNPRGKKRKLVSIREQFLMKESKSEVSGVKKTTAICTHCEKVTQGPSVRINVSRLRDHLVKCPKIPEQRRRLSMQASQRAKKIMKIKNITGSLMVKDNRKGTVFPSSERASHTLGSKPMSVIRAE